MRHIVCGKRHIRLLWGDDHSRTTHVRLCRSIVLNFYNFGPLWLARLYRKKYCRTPDYLNESNGLSKGFGHVPLLYSLELRFFLDPSFFLASQFTRFPIFFMLRGLRSCIKSDFGFSNLGFRVFLIFYGLRFRNCGVISGSVPVHPKTGLLGGAPCTYERGLFPRPRPLQTRRGVNGTNKNLNFDSSIRTDWS